MEKQFKTERAAQQQRRIEDSLVELMTVMPYAEISVCEICRSAALPRRTFYYYFTSKEDVLSSLLGRLLNECGLETISAAQPTRELLEQSFTGFFRYWRDCARKELAALVQSGLEQEVILGALKWAQEEALWRQRTDHLPQELRVIRSLMGISCVFYTLFYWYSTDMEQSPEQMAHYVTQVLINPIFSI